MPCNKESEQAQTTGAPGEQNVKKMSLLDVIRWPPATLPPEKKPQFDFFSQSRRVGERELFHCSVKYGPPPPRRPVCSLRELKSLRRGRSPS